MIDEWQLPPRCDGRIPDVSPGFSGGRVVDGDFPLDQVVIDSSCPEVCGEQKQKLIHLELPAGTTVYSCNRLGASEWTVVARIETRLVNDKRKSFFLKVILWETDKADANRAQCAEYEQGRAMLEGEFHSMNELYKVAPNFVPKPHAWGQLTVLNPNTCYFLCDFIETTGQNLDPIQLCTELVTLHRASKSPTNMFGFHVNPLRGNLPLQTTWNPSWSDFFIQLFHGTLSLDQRINGPWKNLGQLVKGVTTHVVPQVLGPLETDGRSIKPSLIHGGMYPNTAIRGDTS